MAGRKKKKTKKRYQKGRPVRISEEVEQALGLLRAKEGSYDGALRKLLELPTRDGTPNRRKHFWALTRAGELFQTKAKARGRALQLAYAEKSAQVEQPRKLQEPL